MNRLLGPSSFWKRLRFYAAHSWNDLRVGGWRTVFALLCIASGVAAVVSLQTLGAMIEGSLTNNLQELNRGDIRVFPPGPGPARLSRSEVDLDQRYLAPFPGSGTVFTGAGILAIEQAVQSIDPAAEVSYLYRSPDNAIMGTFIDVGNETRSIFPLFIDKNYSVYGNTPTLDGRKVSEVLQNPTDVVISDNAAQDNGYEVGDQIILTDSDTPFTIRGIVEREAEAFTENFIFVTLFGFYYIDQSALPYFNLPDGGANPYAFEVYINLSDNRPENVSEVAQRLEKQFDFLSTTTTSDIRERNTQITSAVNQLVLLMGVVSLLIGGIGIVNTMLVIVARRTTEIAVLKTIGMKAQQVTVLFLVEAIMIGFIGSVVGVIAGVGLAALLQTLDVWFGTRLDWVFSEEAVLRGLVLGVVVTAVFGFLPTLIAGQVRPGNVLRPSSTQLPNIGILQTLGAIAVIIVVMGVVVWTILGNALSPHPNTDLISGNQPGGVLAITLMMALAAGIVGGALVPSFGFIKKPTDQLTTNGKALRGAMMGLGLVLQTLFQGVLFFSVAIVLVAIFLGELATPAIVVSVVIGVVGGVVVSYQAFIQQRAIFVALGGILLAFLLAALVGGLFGALLGSALGAILPTEAWRVIVELTANIALVESIFVLIVATLAVLWFLVTLTARTPSMGVPDVKISLRALVTNRNRVASTLLALVIGVLTLSLVTMFAASLKQYFALNLEENLGGNVVLFTITNDATWERTLSDVETVLDTAEGVENYTLIANYQVDFVALEKADGTRLKREQLLVIMAQNLGNDSRNLSDFFDVSLGSIDGRFVDQTLPQKTFTAPNRQLTADDAGQRVVVVAGNRAMRAAGIEAGDTLVFNFSTESGSRLLSFMVVGVSDESFGDLSSDAGSFIYAPIDAFDNIAPDAMGGVINVEEDKIKAFSREVTQNVDNTVVLETRFLNQIVNRLIDQFTALPFLVALLNLITGGAVIANSVVLSTMERRREIGVMKSLGVQRERVLGMLLLENGLMGFLSGLIGVGASLLLLIWLWGLIFEGDLRGAIPVGTALALMGLCVVIALIAAAATAWNASGEKPLNVLRNE